MNFDQYEPESFYDEMFAGPGEPREGAAALVRRVDEMAAGELQRRQKYAEAALFQAGITFTVYGSEEGTEKIFPFDVLPRIIEAEEWASMEAGLEQRITALNLFIDDIYHDQKILEEGVVPRDLLETSKGFRPQCMGIDPPHGIWCHITGTDLVRDADGTIYVLEDNLRCPSGVSYVLANRDVLKRTFPYVFEQSHIRSVSDYPNRLLDTLLSLVPEGVTDPTAVVLTPGIYNSAYFEHSFLAQQMGIELVEARDLVVHDGHVMMRTTRGFQRVDVIYRRIDDDFLDPKVFREDSMLGVPGIMEVFQNGRVALANAPGTGVADDKAIYAYVPRMIEFYLDQEPILANVPTYICREDEDRAYVLDHLDELVVKATDEAGGYGMLIGPHASEAERGEFAKRIEASPRKYIAQPTLSLSRVPTLIDESIEGRHVDLRPYILYGGTGIYVMPGGLTRVALKKGSLVVNSSQGGGSKDTWVLQAAGNGGDTEPMPGQMQSQSQGIG